MEIAEDDVSSPEVLALLREHLDDMRANSPPHSVHALDASALRAPEVTFWVMRDGPAVLGCGALKALDQEHGEIKSMRTARVHRGQGVGSAMMRHLIDCARARGYRRLSLETGSGPAFAAAWSLYLRFGFRECGPFADYEPDPFSRFMTLLLDD